MDIKHLVFNKSDDTASTDKTVINYPEPAQVMTNTQYFDQKIILPRYTFPGHLIKEEYNGLAFHYIATPSFLEYADFRLTADNKYELLSFDGKPVEEFSEEFLKECIKGMEDNFEGAKDVPEYQVLNENKSPYNNDTRLIIGKIKWFKNTYLREATEEENEEFEEFENENDYSYDHDAYKTESDGYRTDFSLPILQDENGDVLEFVGRLVSSSLTGTYYLFFSPKTRLIRQIFQWHGRVRKYISLKETKDPNEFAAAVKELADPAAVLENAALFERKVILPKYTVPGHFIKKEYKGLDFHFVITPIFGDYIDFRLTAGNKYEVIGLDGTPVSEITEEYIKGAIAEMDSDFDEMATKPAYYVVDKTDNKSNHINSLCICVGTDPSWDQGTFEREKTDEEGEWDEDLSYVDDSNEELWDNEYVTDFTLPVFKDENDDTLEFVCKLYAGSVFGTYYLFFSPKTRLVRQFFQCT